jgi:succinoglycan biosynthesis protein ExoW
MSEHKIAVVVPFFQKEAGILPRALDSIALQKGVSQQEITVLVIDDSSPIPAQQEVAGRHYPYNLTILCRENGGPGAARNTGLDALNSSIEWVAFLDSDDTWTCDHLASGISALKLGSGTFFFANHFQLNADTPAFERGGRLNLTRHKHLDGDLYLFSGTMVEQVVGGNIIGTSTVVLHWPTHRWLRFRTRFRRAGEDYLMWMDAAREGAVFVFRSTPSTIYRRGVNVYSGVKWGTVELVERILDEREYLQEMLRTYELPTELQVVLGQRIASKERECRQSLLAALRREPFASLRLLSRMLGSRRN